MDATQIIGIVLITFGVSTMVGAGFGFYTGYNKGQSDFAHELNRDVTTDAAINHEIKKAKRLAAYSYFMNR